MPEHDESPETKGLLKFASIDIGSNAVRLLFCNVYKKPDGETVFKKASLIRVPIRLGEDAFSIGKISENRSVKLIHTMEAFAKLIGVNEVLDYRACATSAMREASNSEELVNRIFQTSGIRVEVIDGKHEAEIIYSNHIEQLINPNKNYLYIDVGGGSTEVTLFSNGKIIASASFNIGTIRLLHNKVSKSDWQSLKDWVEQASSKYDAISGIGSGGNINKLVGLARKKDERQISYSKLKELHQTLTLYSVQDRITLLGMNPDRADVIVPATEIFIAVMKAANVQKIMVPQIGLSDGIIHLLYEKHQRLLLTKKNAPAA